MVFRKENLASRQLVAALFLPVPWKIRRPRPAGGAPLRAGQEISRLHVRNCDDIDLRLRINNRYLVRHGYDHCAT